jgi:hypothetical protein
MIPVRSMNHLCIIDLNVKPSYPGEKKDGKFRFKSKTVPIIQLAGGWPLHAT